MKQNIFKKTWKLSCLFALALLAVVSCKDDSDDNGPSTLIEDGWYISGEATSFTDLTATNLFKGTTNENDKVSTTNRSGLYSKYVYLTSNKTFVITKVEGGKPTVYGISDTLTYNAKGKNDQLKSTVLWGKLTAGKTVPVAKTSMYQVCFDVTTNRIAVAELTHWGVIGGATPGGWGGDQTMNLVGSLSAETNTYSVEGIILTVDAFKFRHSGGWKIQLSDTAAMTDNDGGVKVNANYGGTADALVPGGANIPNTVNGIYTISLTWTKTSGEFTATVTKTGDYTPPAFPDSMYIVGNAVSTGWPTAGPGENKLASMHAVADGPNKGVYWKICYLNATPNAFKISAKNWTDPNLGFAQVTSFDANGITVSDAGGNMSVATAGMYMIVLDLRNSEKKVSIMAPKVYGMGPAFGGYNEDIAGNLFTVNNTAKTLISPAITADGAIRIYADHPWIPSWWNAEFNVYSTEIQYRNDGGDQTAVTGTTGKVITLHFDDNTGSIQ